MQDVVDPANGTTIKTVNVGYGYDQWTADSRRLLAVHTVAGTFRELSW